MTADPLRMTEDDLLTAVLALCRQLRLRTAHFRPARTGRGWRTPVQGDGAGWPDLIIVGSRLIVRELKAGRGRPTPAQQAWLTALLAAGVDTMVWRPEDWRNGRIEVTLRGLVTS